MLYIYSVSQINEVHYLTGFLIVGAIAFTERAIGYGHIIIINFELKLLGCQ